MKYIQDLEGSCVAYILWNTPSQAVVSHITTVIIRIRLNRQTRGKMMTKIIKRSQNLEFGTGNLQIAQPSQLAQIWRTYFGSG